jgi:hypothetical protein
MSYFDDQTEAVQNMYRYGLEPTLRLYNRNAELDRELLAGLLRALDSRRAEWEDSEHIPRAAVNVPEPPDDWRAPRPSDTGDGALP